MIAAVLAGTLVAIFILIINSGQDGDNIDRLQAQIDSLAERLEEIEGPSGEACPVTTCSGTIQTRPYNYMCSTCHWVIAWEDEGG